MIRPRAPRTLDAAALYDSLGDAPAPALGTITPFATRFDRHARRVALRRAARDGRTLTDDDAAARRRLNRADAVDSLSDLRVALARLAWARTGFGERLLRFWANHFAADSRQGHFRFARESFVDGALRPHIASDFATLLRAAITHPVMQNYLNQNVSVGPDSLVGRRTGRGANENLARELLELHTLGHDGGYTQADIGAVARLLTGVTFDLQSGAKFDARIAQPGLVTIMGRRYGGRPPTAAHVDAFLQDLALHPATARHLAGKLARHFVDDAPDPQLVAHMAASYRAARGDLRALYRAMLEHPGAWGPGLGKTRPPLDWMAAALRATGARPRAVLALDPGATHAQLRAPLKHMGAPHEAVPSPAGYPDTADAWVAPQGLAARIDCAMGLAQRLPVPPDPRALVEAGLGPLADAGLRRAAAGAETRAQGVGVVLAAPGFIRR